MIEGIGEKMGKTGLMERELLSFWRSNKLRVKSSKKAIVAI